MSRFSLSSCWRRLKSDTLSRVLFLILRIRCAADDFPPGDHCLDAHDDRAGSDLPAHPHADRHAIRDGHRTLRGDLLLCPHDRAVCVVGLYGSSLRTMLYNRSFELKQSNKRIEELAELDELDRSLNRRSIMRTLDSEEFPAPIAPAHPVQSR